MAGNYGNFFGFRRSTGPERWTVGTTKTPAASALLMGTVVELDFASPGYLKQSAKDAKPQAGVCGILLQELQWDRSIYQSDVSFVDTIEQGVCNAGRLSVITGGAGIKVWYKNVAGTTRSDGRVVTARTLYSTAGTLAAGDEVAWDGAKFIKLGQGTTTVPFGKAVTVTSSMLEIVLYA